MAFQKQPRRANLATIVGSSLAVAAAGSLLAFSSLAEQAGLEGLATGRLQPAHPGRSGGGGHAITVPAPATQPPGDPRDDLVELVRRTTADERVRTLPTLEPAETVAAPEPRPEKPAKPEPRRIDRSARVAVAQPEVDDEPAETDGPPYGHAYGHHKDKHKDKAPKPGKKHAPKAHSDEAPVYARSAHDEGKSKPPKAPKMQKVKKVKKANPGNGKAKGHSKHAHKGKGKGHSKHGG